MRIFKLFLAVIATIVSLCLAIKTNGGYLEINQGYFDSLFIYLIIFLISIPLFLLYKDKRNNKLYTIIMSLVVFLIILGSVYLFFQNKMISVYYLTNENVYSYDYQELGFYFDSFFKFLYFLFLFVTLLDCSYQFINNKTSKDALTIIVLIFTIVIHLNILINLNLYYISDDNFRYISQNYWIFIIILICSLVYNKINSLN
mgnify:FL=1